MLSNSIVILYELYTNITLMFTTTPVYSILYFLIHYNSRSTKFRRKGVTGIDLILLNPVPYISDVPDDAALAANA